MDQKEKKKIQIKKKTGYNVYGLKQNTFRVLAGLLVGITAASVLDTMLLSLPLFVRLECEVALVVLVVLVLFLRGRQEEGYIEPYRRSDGFEFLGLYNLSVEKDLNSKDILSREEEAGYIRQTLEDLVFPQKNIKQAICLTGKSGCGKSTILSFFRHLYGQDYHIVEMTDNYLNFRMTLEKHFGSEIDSRIDQMLHAKTADGTPNKKLIFILDQFERFFFLEEKKKEEIKGLIMMMARKDTALILSMREEYLADFMKEFNVNDLKRPGKERSSKATGILNDLISTIRDRDKKMNVFSGRGRQAAADKWNDGLIKANQYIHLAHTGSAFEDAALERVGNTIFYCENQNEENGASYMETKCETIFGDEGVVFYEKHKQEPLIQQQISFHMAEYEKKRKRISTEALHEMFEMEDYELLNHYFDVQLTSTGDYYNASRILYLLASARIHQVVMRQTDLEFGLIPDQFSKEGHKALPDVIGMLEELQLIKKNIKDSDLEYEIAHDFIAQAYLNYSSSNIDRNVRGALDLYMSEYLDTGKKAGIAEKRKHFGKVQKSAFYRNITITFAVLAVAAYLFVNLVYNPWMTGLERWNPYGSVKSLFPLFGTEMCLVYLFNMYHKVFRFCRGKKERTCRISYIVLMLGTLITMFAYPHNMLCIGAFLAVMGFFGAFLLDGTYQRASRMELRNYGLKCALMGIAFMFFHLVIWAFNPLMPRYMIVVEMIMTCVLIGYAFMAHMTKENLYGRIMDASSERVIQE